jgi:hypothetical protein
MGTNQAHFIENFLPVIMFGAKLTEQRMERVYGYTLEIPLKAIHHRNPNQFISVPRISSWSFALNF